MESSVDHAIPRRRPLAPLLFLALAAALPAQTTESGPRLICALEIRDPASGDVEVSVLVANPPESEVELALMSRAPGRWLRDDFAALVSDERALLEGEREIPVERVGAARWRLPARGENVLFRYRCHAGRAGVGLGLVEQRGALIAPGAVLPRLVGARGAPIEIFVTGPEGWRFAATLAAGDGPGRFRAAGFDELADAAILAGPLEEHLIATERLRLRLFGLVAEPELSGLAAATLAALAPGLDGLVGAEGEEPAEATLLLHALGEADVGFRCRPGPTGGAGALVVATGDRKDLGELLAAAALGAALGGRLAPGLASFAEPDELPVRDDLWLEDALLRYLGLHRLARAGLVEEAALLARLGALVERSEAEPAARRMSLRAAARRMALRREQDPRRVPDDQAESWIDPLVRGRAVALLLDLDLRRRSGGAQGLEEALRSALAEGPLDLAGLRGALDRLGGRGTAQLLDALLDETTAPPFAALAREAGFAIAAGGAGVGLGLELEGDVVAAVRPGSPAARAGIQARDRVRRLGGRVVAADTGERIAAMRSGERTTITVERRGRLLTLPLEVAGLVRSGLVLVPGDDEAKAAIRRGFLGSKEDG